ncbi:MAG: hypothetical protein MJ094_02250 [Saccharofermentans sp.]|nr:hypothetical protein [Saccharofermentans sp.]
MIKDVVFKPDEIGNCDDIASLISKRIHSGKKIYITKSYIDARKKPNVKVVYRVTDEIPANPDVIALPLKGRKFNLKQRPVIIGFGPSGMFAGLILAEYGLRPLILEIGKDAASRSIDISESWETGKINPNSNIMFGEGGAGTFSDGKLFSGISSPYKAFINKVFINCGADKDIDYDAHPHVGTDILVNVVANLRRRIIDLGGEVRFESKVTDIKVNNGRISSVLGENFEIPCENLIIAGGHGDKMLFEMLMNRGLVLTAKPFSVGVRIEHKRIDVDMCQYGFDTSLYKNISAANYKLSVDTPNDSCLYTFCMCPGGHVISSGSSTDKLCTNGMSYRARDNENSNSALLVPVLPQDIYNDVFALFDYRERLEHKAYELGGSTGKAPCLTVGDFLGINKTNGLGNVNPSFRPGINYTDFSEVFEDTKVVETIKYGIELMARKAKFFSDPNAVLTAVEAGSSSPVRILRDKETLQSVSVKGIYPCGEGAGYAGGIMSCAVDGIKCANRLAQSMLL